MKLKYNWQHPDWPNFSYESAQTHEFVYQYVQKAGRLAGGITQLKGTVQYDAYVDLMVSEAIYTSQIEGERLNHEDVRSSIKNFLGLNPQPVRVSNARAEGMAALMVDVRKTFTAPLTKEVLFHWHQLVFPVQESLISKPVLVGQWRTSQEPMQIVSGPIGYEKIHYEAPPAHIVGQEMTRFFNWYNQTNPLNNDAQKISGPVRAAIAHLWFETIHPFDDGNGRIGRAIAEHALAQDLGRPPLLSLSTIIEQDKKAYYAGLHEASTWHAEAESLNINEWVNWFCRMVLTAQNAAAKQVDHILKRVKFLDHYQDQLSERQKKAIEKIFKAGPDGFEFGINAKKYMGLSGCSKATATRDLASLVKKGCLIAIETVGRNARYELNLNEDDIFKF